MSDWNKGNLCIRKMEMIYSFYLESSDVCDFDVWLKRHTEFTDYQIKRLMRFRNSPRAGQICDSHAWD